MATSNCGLAALELTHPRLRIASVFIVLAASGVGAFTPILLAEKSRSNTSHYIAFSICKYIGTGAIIATAWLHLLAPAAEKLADPCLEPKLGTYPWASAIGLWTVMVMLLLEMLAKQSSYYARTSTRTTASDGSQAYESESMARRESLGNDSDGSGQLSIYLTGSAKKEPILNNNLAIHNKDYSAHNAAVRRADMASQLLVISILEFGAVFHSFLVGLTLGTAKHIVMLLVVLVFHQIFEGLGLGARLAVAPWPANRHYVPYVLAGVFSLATPVGVAVGLGVQPKSADTQKLVGGIFSAISAGILMYTGLVELFARELLFGMSTGSPRMIAIAFGSVAFGMAAMSLLAKWA